MPYTVKKGDTLGRIAAAYSTTVAELVRLNPQIKDPDLIGVGWSLKLPSEEAGGGGAPNAPKPPPQDPTKKAWSGQTLKNVPGKPEVWKVGKEYMLVYMVPGTEDDPVYMAWSATSMEQVNSWFGPGKTPVVNRELTGAQFASTGALRFGVTNEIPPGADNPFAAWSVTIREQAKTQPWIMDEDYQRLMAVAMLEGREVTEAEIQTTKWWKTHSKSEREWMKLKHGDPKTATQTYNDNRSRIIASLKAAGAGSKMDSKVIDYMAAEYTQGRWSDTKLSQQITALTDPYSGIKVDAGLAKLNVASIGDTQEGEDKVRDLLATWLGPAFGNRSDAEIRRIAGLIRNDPDYEQNFIEGLKDQRMAVLPNYTDRNTSYAAIANTWKQWWMGQWGEMPDEKDNLFISVLQSNDTEESAKKLRSEGLKRGVEKVRQDLSSQSMQLGNSERRPIISG